MFAPFSFEDLGLVLSDANEIQLALGDVQLVLDDSMVYDVLFLGIKQDL